MYDDDFVDELDDETWFMDDSYEPLVNALLEGLGVPAHLFQGGETRARYESAHQRVVDQVFARQHQLAYFWNETAPLPYADPVKVNWLKDGL